MVTAAALIMVSVAAFVLTNHPIVKSIGFALALGVGIDAFLIRMTLLVQKRSRQLWGKEPRDGWDLWTASSWQTRLAVR